VGKQLYPAQRNQAFSNGHLDQYKGCNSEEARASRKKSQGRTQQ
jgi:hypothetical protein